LARATQEANTVIVPALTGADGAAQIKVSGGATSTVAVTLDGAKLAARGVTLPQIQQALGAAQVDLPAGQALQADRSLPVEVLGTVKPVDDLRSLPVGGTPARPVLLGDVSTVTEAPAPVNGIARTNGVPSLEIQVIRASNGNAVALSNDIRSRVSKL